MHIVVLGAGVIGTTTAWYLREAGHDVTVLERRGGPGQETSFANGGQISVSHAEPWAGPGAPRQLARWLFSRGSPLRFQPRMDWHQWLWGLQFLRECGLDRYRRNLRQVVELGLYSRGCLQSLRKRTGIEYHHREAGILHFYTNPRVFDKARAPAQRMTELGCERRIIDAADATRIEPALGCIGDRIEGATYTPGDESGDARVFTQRLAAMGEASGIRFCYNTRIMGLEHEGGRIAGVRVNRDGAFDRVSGDAYVVAIGSFSAPLLRPLGVRLPVYPARGYSVTVPVKQPEKAYSVSLIDDEYKLVYSRLGDTLRVAGMAEIGGYRQDLDHARCRQILERASACFPEGGDWGSAQFWAGLRPATPSSVPCIGGTTWPNLWLNTGHGTLGWTHACGSAAVLRDLVAGRDPEVRLDARGRW
mgnify:CR=1 FL=1